MSNGSSALGKYAALVASIVVLLVIGSTLVMHVLGKSDPLLDDAFILCIGIVLGVGGSLTRLNGTVAKVDTHEAALAALQVQVTDLATKVT